MSIRMEGSFNFDQLQARLTGAIPGALRLGAEHIGEASAQQVPIEEGTLLRSQKIVVDADRHQASISYDGPYAAYQHEILELRHEHGNAKFLELPLVSEARTAFGIIARYIKRFL